ncbi:hypothetical protein VP01_2765g2 [Puccinia sorghi]|uniref:CWH43-like N-terminal domain-containing protein n=1 Tax=Puccinia sorghi TaxID=27349 RepID=A0A0L6V2X5_9BASI|nr:hypothetical protein VP01_2765g2 [Puccinia sorghi]
MKFLTYGAYICLSPLFSPRLPVLTAVIWFGMLVGLLLFWLVNAHGKRYRDDEASILFISDIGAAHKSWFSPGCTLVFSFYTMTLLAERWLRYHQRIPQVIGKRQRYWGFSTAIIGILGGFSLMMLSFLDTFNHPTAHWCFTFTFMIFIAGSSFSQIIEVYFLHKEFPHRVHLRRNAALKSSIIFISTALGVVFGSKPTAKRDNRLLSIAAICEWSVAFLLTFYFLTFALDFWPAAKTSTRFQGQLDSRFMAGSRETSDEFEKKLHLGKLQGFII